MKSTYFTRAQAERFVSEQAFEPVRAFFVERKPALTMEVVLRFRGYSRVVLKENPDNYGVYFVNPDAPVPFLWFGMAWRREDPAGTLPSWGASLEVNGPYLERFNEDGGGLQSACEAMDGAADGALGLHRFEGHVELAMWKGFDWLLKEEDDQGQALEHYWANYLTLLKRGGLPAAVKAFNRACGFDM